jgi:hypothetical protein
MSRQLGQFSVGINSQRTKMKLLALYAAIFVLASATATAQTDTQKAEDKPVTPREGTVFGLLLGQDTVAEVASRVRHQDHSTCVISIREKKECRPTYEIDSFGYLDIRGDSVTVREYSSTSPVTLSEADVLFTKFSVDGEYLTGTFFKDRLVALSVNSRYRSKLDSDVDTKALVASFDKKYKKQASPFVKTQPDRGGGVTYKTTEHVWKDPTDTFTVRLTRNDSVPNNKLACLKFDQVMVSIGVPSSSSTCYGPRTDYQLDYRAPELYAQAFSLARQLEADAKAQKDNAATKRVNKY